MRDGRRIRGPETLEDIRRRSTQELARLPAGLRALQDGPSYPVIVAKAVRELAAKLDRQSMQN
jgi:nicotinate phosphoribosyltransferase